MQRIKEKVKKSFKKYNGIFRIVWFSLIILIFITGIAYRFLGKDLIIERENHLKSIVVSLEPLSKYEFINESIHSKFFSQSLFYYFNSKDKEKVIIDLKKFLENKNWKITKYSYEKLYLYANNGQVYVEISFEYREESWVVAIGFDDIFDWWMI